MNSSESKVFVYVATLVAIVLLSVVGGCTYDAKYTKQDETTRIRLCVEAGGQWVTEQIDKDVYPTYVCKRS